MAKDEHVALLGRGAVTWNTWRAEEHETPDLSRAALRGFDLTGFDLSQADLRDADLRGANCSNANLSGAHLGKHRTMRTLATVWQPRRKVEAMTAPDRGLVCQQPRLY